VHYSLLPKYRGAAPAAWTIINGEPQGGVTPMRLVEKWTPALSICRTRFLSRVTKPPARCKKTHTDRCSFALGNHPRTQTRDAKAVGTGRSTGDLGTNLKKEDGLIDWRRSAVEIERRVRGFDPWPVATLT